MTHSSYVANRKQIEIFMLNVKNNICRRISGEEGAGCVWQC